jgi:hypothetical protein
MLIDTQHLHHWMNAVRISNNPMRTLDAFWRGQIKSKEWLIENLESVINSEVNRKEETIEIHGGWVGTLASLLFQSNLNIHNIVSIDIDPVCQHVAEEMNRLEVTENRFRSEIGDMCNRFPVSSIVINTSCEHVTQEQYDQWLNNMLANQLLVIQSNNYDIPEHIRISQNLNEFEEQSKLSKIMFRGELELPLYKRFMIIGYK